MISNSSTSITSTRPALSSQVVEGQKLKMVPSPPPLAPLTNITGCDCDARITETLQEHDHSSTINSSRIILNGGVTKQSSLLEAKQTRRNDSEDQHLSQEASEQVYCCPLPSPWDDCSSKESTTRLQQLPAALDQQGLRESIHQQQYQQEQQHNDHNIKKRRHGDSYTDVEEKLKSKHSMNFHTTTAATKSEIVDSNTTHNSTINTTKEDTTAGNNVRKIMKSGEAKDNVMDSITNNHSNSCVDDTVNDASGGGVKQGDTKSSIIHGHFSLTCVSKIDDKVPTSCSHKHLNHQHASSADEFKTDQHILANISFEDDKNKNNPHGNTDSVGYHDASLQNNDHHNITHSNSDDKDTIVNNATIEIKLTETDEKEPASVHKNEYNMNNTRIVGCGNIDGGAGVINDANTADRERTQNYCQGGLSLSTSICANLQNTKTAADDPANNGGSGASSIIGMRTVHDLSSMSCSITKNAGGYITTDHNDSTTMTTGCPSLTNDTCHQKNNRVVLNIHNDAGKGIFLNSSLHHEDLSRNFISYNCDSAFTKTSTAAYVPHCSSTTTTTSSNGTNNESTQLIHAPHNVDITSTSYNYDAYTPDGNNHVTSLKQRHGNGAHYHAPGLSCDRSSRSSFYHESSYINHDYYTNQCNRTSTTSSNVRSFDGSSNPPFGHSNINDKTSYQHHDQHEIQSQQSFASGVTENIPHSSYHLNLPQQYLPSNYNKDPVIYKPSSLGYHDFSGQCIHVNNTNSQPKFDSMYPVVSSTSNSNTGESSRTNPYIGVPPDGTLMMHDTYREQGLGTGARDNTHSSCNYSSYSKSMPANHLHGSIVSMQQQGQQHQRTTNNTSSFHNHLASSFEQRSIGLEKEIFNRHTPYIRREEDQFEQSMPSLNSPHFSGIGKQRSSNPAVWVGENSTYLQPLGGQHLPYYERNILPLSTSDDENWLSEFLCFVRSQCTEVFRASHEDVAARMNSKKVLIGQVGIRCRFCAHLPHRERTGRSSSFPSSISRIYQSLTMMLRDHFTKCSAMPPRLHEHYLTLKANASQGATDSKRYWIDSGKFSMHRL